MSRDAETRAVVLLSGGLDSATVLAKARADGRCCYALSVDYGQRHRAELDAAARLAARLGAVEHRVVHVDFGQFGGSALTDPALDVPTAPSAGIPITYVPARNTIMLALGLGWCEVLDAPELYIGVNGIHYLHLWCMSPTESVLTFHLVIPAGYPGDDFMDDLAQTLTTRFSIAHSTLQVEQGTTDHACALHPE